MITDRSYFSSVSILSICSDGDNIIIIIIIIIGIL